MYYDLKETGKRIKSLRKQKNMTQDQLADKLNISVSNLGKIETGYSGASIDLLIEMAMFFDISLDYMFLGRDMQTDKLKKQIRMMLGRRIEIDQQL
ncbi:helix-turn-helix transcriptional regulator [Roseburia sp. BX1005]|uniref:Helix-turn-helix transcriptional regulator n=1 Tax=Roseburia zhanii TaxID=2763064 RepID=A0A923RRM9_9FIRM|nr:helix-turn-helix transcriptional regulator [Roseburia zhanii]MBC5712732.1 helix-turn-helix transcriptional regulator [Roseburia zhanii]